MTPTDIAYLAGYFDGEGCITVKYGLRMLVTATYPAGCLKLQHHFGGVVTVKKTSDAKPHHKKQYQWTVYGPRARHALETLQPFLLEKKRQCRDALLWYAADPSDRSREFLAHWIQYDKHCSWALETNMFDGGHLSEKNPGESLE